MAIIFDQYTNLERGQVDNMYIQETVLFYK